MTVSRGHERHSIATVVSGEPGSRSHQLSAKKEVIPNIGLVRGNRHAFGPRANHDSRLETGGNCESSQSAAPVAWYQSLFGPHLRRYRPEQVKRGSAKGPDLCMTDRTWLQNIILVRGNIEV